MVINILRILMFFIRAIDLKATLNVTLRIVFLPALSNVKINKARKLLIEILQSRIENLI